MLLDTSLVPAAACCTVRAISCVAAPCCCTAAAIADEMPWTSTDGSRRSAGWPRPQDRSGSPDRADLRADLLGRLGCLVGQHLDLGRHDDEALAGFARARRLDRRVERQQIGLRRRCR